MLGSQRKSEIIERVLRDGSVVAADLAEEWKVSEDTIRRDLRELAAAAKVHRVHGGAVPASPAVADYSTRTTVASASKIEVATCAASMIRSGQTIFLDGGTTAASICRALAPSLDITIVTHSPTVAVALVECPAIRVLLVGGTLYRHSIVATGALATEYINALSVDMFFMGVTGVHPKHGLTTGDAEEAAIKRTISRRAAETFVLGSSEKIGSVSPHRVVGFDQIAGVITDERDPQKLKALQRAGLTIVRT